MRALRAWITFPRLIGAALVTGCALLSCQIVSGLENPSPVPDAARDAGGAADAHAADAARFCDAHPGAWICEQFDNPDAGPSGWMSCLFGPSAVLEVSTASFVSPPSALHVVIGADDVGDAALDPDKCVNSAFIHRDRNDKDMTTHRMELDARLGPCNRSHNADVAFAGFAYNAGDASSAPAIYVTASGGSLGFRDWWRPEPSDQVFNSPATAWFHVSMSIDNNGTDAHIVLEEEGVKARTSSELPITAKGFISAQFGLRASSPTDCEIYIDNVVVE